MGNFILQGSWRQRNKGLKGEIEIPPMPSAPPAPSYKVYTALLTQSGTNAPVATVLENTIGQAIIWSYDSIGLYLGTELINAPVDKTTVMITNNTSAFPNYVSCEVQDYSNNIIVIQTYDYTTSFVSSDNILYKALLEIRVYN